MKKIIVSMMFVSLFSCTPNMYLKNTYGKSFRQCTIPNMFAISSDIPHETKQIIYNGFIYWNKVLDRKMFIHVNSNNNIAVIYVNIKNSTLEKSGHQYCVKNEMKFTNSSCLMGNNVTINSSCAKNHEILETTVRHLAGNILGLANQVKPGTLMHYQIQPGAQNPIDANEEEIEAIQMLYR